MNAATASRAPPRPGQALGARRPPTSGLAGVYVRALEGAGTGGAAGKAGCRGRETEEGRGARNRPPLNARSSQPPPSFSRHEPALRAALASLTSLSEDSLPVAASVLAAAPFLLGVASDPGALDAGSLLAPE